MSSSHHRDHHHHKQQQKQQESLSLSSGNNNSNDEIDEYPYASDYAAITPTTTITPIATTDIDSDSGDDDDAHIASALAKRGAAHGQLYTASVQNAHSYTSTSTTDSASSPSSTGAAGEQQQQHHYPTIDELTTTMFYDPRTLDGLLWDPVRDSAGVPVRKTQGTYLPFKLAMLSEWKLASGDIAELFLTSHDQDCNDIGNDNPMNSRFALHRVLSSAGITLDINNYLVPGLFASLAHLLNPHDNKTILLYDRTLIPVLVSSSAQIQEVPITEFARAALMNVYHVTSAQAVQYPPNIKPGACSTGINMISDTRFVNHPITQIYPFCRYERNDKASNPGALEVIERENYVKCGSVPRDYHCVAQDTSLELVWGRMVSEDKTGIDTLCVTSVWDGETMSAPPTTSGGGGNGNYGKTLYEANIDEIFKMPSSSSLSAAASSASVSGVNNAAKERSSAGEIMGDIVRACAPNVVFVVKHDAATVSREVALEIESALWAALNKFSTTNAQCVYNVFPTLYLGGAFVVVAISARRANSTLGI